MNKIDSLVAEFNSEFVVSNSRVDSLLRAHEVVDFSDTNTVYFCSNRKEQVCQMFRLRDRGVISWDENIELQARTKGFAVDKIVSIARPMRAALNNEAPVVDNSAEVEALRALLAERDAEIAELRVRVHALVRAYEAVVSGVRLIGKGVVTSKMKEIVGVK